MYIKCIKNYEKMHENVPHYWHMGANSGGQQGTCFGHVRAKMFGKWRGPILGANSGGQQEIFSAGPSDLEEPFSAM